MSDTAQVVRLERLSDLVEEEVTLSIGDCELVCFAGARPYKLIEGSSYPVRLNLLILDDYRIYELDDDSEEIISRRGSGYSYQVKGRLIEGHLHACGFTFENGAFESDYVYLEGKMMSIDVDRIDAKFLPK